VPVLLIVVPIAEVIFLVLLRYLHRRDRFSAPRATVAFSCCVYAAGVVANTLFAIYLNKPASNAPWRVYVAPFMNLARELNKQESALSRCRALTHP
jgi:hypothetical protein